MDLEPLTRPQAAAKFGITIDSLDPTLIDIHLFDDPFLKPLLEAVCSALHK